MITARKRTPALLTAAGAPFLSMILGNALAGLSTSKLIMVQAEGGLTGTVSALLAHWVLNEWSNIGQLPKDVKNGLLALHQHRAIFVSNAELRKKLERAAASVGVVTPAL